MEESLHSNSMKPEFIAAAAAVRIKRDGCVIGMFNWW